MLTKFPQKLLKAKIFVLVLLLLIIPSFSSLLRPGFFPMQDDLQAFRIQQMDKCIGDLQIPCRWIPDAGYQYGYPLFNYYAPGVYYLGEVFHLVGFGFIDSVKILFILGFITGALGMYILVKEFFGPYPALIASVLYTYAPFKAVEVYVRGSLSEFFALTFFPLIFWSSYKLVKTGKLNYALWFCISLGALLITHNLLPVIFLPITAIWITYWLFMEKKGRKLKKIISFSLLGVGLAAFFVLPMLFERKYVHVETLLSGYFDYRQHFVDLRQMFLSNNWGYGSSVLGPHDDLALSSGLVLLTLGLIAGVLAIANIKRQKKIAPLVLLLLSVELGVLFLMHLRSSFIWEALASLAWLQFPWRFLSDSIFILAFIAAFAIHFSGKFKYALGAATIVAVFLLYGSFFQPKAWFNMTDKEKFEGTSWEKQLTISIFDYLPIYAQLPPEARAPELPEVLQGDVKFMGYKKGSDYHQGTVEVNENSTLRVPLFDFPGMKVLVDGVETPHYRDCSNQDPCLGLVTFNLEPGDKLVKVELKNTPVRATGNIISIFSGLVVLGLFFRRHEKEAKIFG